MPSTPVYALHLIDGGGDGTHHLITQELWDWIHAPVATMPRINQGELRIEHHTDDPTAPASLLEAMRKEWPDEEPAARVTIGSFENDKAIHARIGSVHNYVSTKQLMKWLADHPEYDLQDLEYDGAMY